MIEQMHDYGQSNAIALEVNNAIIATNPVVFNPICRAQDGFVTHFHITIKCLFGNVITDCIVMNALEKFTSTTIITVTVCAITLIEAILKMSALKFILPVGLFITGLACDKESTFLVTRAIYETTKHGERDLAILYSRGTNGICDFKHCVTFVNAVQRRTGEPKNDTKRGQASVGTGRGFEPHISQIRFILYRKQSGRSVICNLQFISKHVNLHLNKHEWVFEQ